MFWPFSRKKPSPLLDDCVSLNQYDKFRGITQRTTELLKAGREVLLVAHFPECAEALLTVMAEAGMTPARPSGTLTPAQISSRRAQGTTGVLVLSSQLAAPPSIGGPAGALHERVGEASAKPGVMVFCAERHLLRTRDERVVEFAAGFRAGEGGAEVQFHVSLNDTLMSFFVGDSTRQILMSMGMEAGDSIHHPMLSKNIRRAQEKLAAQLPLMTDREARSAAHWCELNGIETN